MSAITITLPERYPFVVAAGISTFGLSLWQGVLVSRYRKKAGIAYPQAYAEKAEAEASIDAMKFNCAQRAHQNTIENLPHLLFGLLVTGVRYPTLAAVIGFSSTLGRVMYTLGYSSGTPKNRYNKGGGIAMASNLVLFLASTWATVEMLLEYFEY
ncbi:membrane-associated proteins in eicosanoid and glutathione metabolism [Rickenella mellea]|uniref:Membrane-associated proteins in eicosanoid and glutathione metabolism n=1 Tax=Rickenella mellea TaxID=50990 RepID=A0A4Y7Q125_9AGAM|nr:membrane-associated proteins in eicosanoid and glutathione metabolism [Rickenella mellea]